MASWDNYEDAALKDPEVRAAYEKAQEHAQYHEDHPEQCPHNAIVAPVFDDLIGGRPGFCLHCNADDVMERDTDCPLCEAEA